MDESICVKKNFFIAKKIKIKIKIKIYFFFPFKILLKMGVFFSKNLLFIIIFWVYCVSIYIVVYIPLLCFYFWNKG
jgi:hypothetical protein